jgi:hypothetical protein
MFCELETDRKTFDYLRRYLHEWREHHDLTRVDNEITAQEIEQHILLHNYYDKKSQEVMQWIKLNGQPFRAYLNTIKIALIAYHIAGLDTNDITWEEFCKIRERLNEVKGDLLDTVMVEKVSQSTTF